MIICACVRAHACVCACVFTNNVYNCFGLGVFRTECPITGTTQTTGTQWLVSVQLCIGGNVIRTGSYDYWYKRTVVIVMVIFRLVLTTQS